MERKGDFGDLIFLQGLQIYFLLAGQVWATIFCPSLGDFAYCWAILMSSDFPRGWPNFTCGQIFDALDPNSRQGQISIESRKQIFASDLFARASYFGRIGFF